MDPEQQNITVEIEETVVEETVVEEPVVVEPIVVEPIVVEPIVEEPVVEEPVVVEPVVVEPVVVEPVVVEPVVVEPVVEEPVVEEPVVPKYAFIIPYRDRQQQRDFFEKHMKFVLEDIAPSDYKTFFIHQCDSKSFNRGAMKNIGFLFIKDKYPDSYKNITLVFNDVDTVPYTKNYLKYDTIHGKVKHFYGFNYSLGGIVSIKASDFEKTKGFPNFWAWGYEDNMFQKRVSNSNLHIDRGQFHDIGDKNIFQMKNGFSRIVNKGEFDKYLSNTQEGVDSIKSLIYDYDESINFVNVRNFDTGTQENPSKNMEYDLRNGNAPFKLPTRRRPSMMMRL